MSMDVADSIYGTSTNTGVTFIDNNDGENSVNNGSSLDRAHLGEYLKVNNVTHPTPAVAPLLCPADMNID